MSSRRLFACSSCGVVQHDSDGACLYCGSPTVPIGEDVDPASDLFRALRRMLGKKKQRLPVFSRC